VSKTIGMIGLGIMGGAIAANLLERGWRVHGCDPDPARSEAFAARGGTVEADAAAVARAVSHIVTSLPSPTAAATVAAAIAASGAAPAIVTETSTLALPDKMGFRDTLAAAGHTALDCPLSGTGAQAANRDLVVYASGPDSAIAALEPAFADFARESHRLGEYGNGTRMKLVANLLVAIHNVAAAEAMVLAARAGLDPDLVVRLAGAGAGGSRMFQMRAPMMARHRYVPAAMRVSTWAKDMAIIGDLARELGAVLPLFEASAPIYAAALASGRGEEDTAAVHAIIEAMAHQKS
jgi:L-threonate 2-dehydrogenase